VEFNEKHAVVLGGTSGIGLATAMRLQGHGAHVVVVGRSEDKLAAARERGFDARQLDVLDRAGMAALFADLGTVDLLVAAATGGGRALGPFLSMDLDAYQGSFRKLWGYTNAVQIGAPHVADDGAIVLISGAPARRARPGQAALASVGGAVEAFVRAVAPELAPKRINVVSPGVIDTPLIAGAGEERHDRLVKATANNPIPRVGTADEAAGAVLFALGNAFVTGTTIDVDGGWLLA
jgi:NAD(P)-dependent dehydrogenase (short-subunit alcohol dehydrogenase family)